MEKQDNVILIGKKPVRIYAEAVNVQFDGKGSKEVILKARGTANVGKAINISEFLKRKNLKIEVKNISTGSETFKDKEKPDRDIYVSTIEIILTKN